ncbi:hypothetical protein KEM60_03319 [Austwickia sp. TVS 96-490-7B]|nr:hypothetical protein [Austwickia sp. TVS 96-490-7B]
MRGADGDADGDGRLLAAVRREGCAALVPLMPEGAPAEPWWVGALGVELGSVGVTGDSQVWWVTRSAGAPSQMHRRIWDAATTTGVEMATVGSVSQRCRHVRAEAVGPDGTAIPYVVTDDPAWRSGSARPVLLTVYGGFGVEHWPEAEPTVAAWVQAGGVVVTAQVRGGGEFGPQWHEAGSGEWKGRAAVDVLTVARALVDRGVTCPGGVMLCGASHGGLVAASAALLDDGDPAVVGGVAVTAPLLDVTDVSRHGNGQFWAAEFPAGRAARAAVSPLWLVRQGDRRLPPLWVASMGRDERVADDAADFVAAWARRGEVTHRREEESAHVGDRLAQIDARSADLLGFAWRAASAAVMG